MTPPTRLRARFPQPLLIARLACAASLVGALTAASPALAAGQAPPAAPPGQKPPCVPATSYLRGYDCELFPLPSLPAKPAAPEAPPVVVAVVPGAAVPVVVPAPAPGPAPVAVVPVAVPAGAAPPALPEAPVAVVPAVPVVAVVPPPTPTDTPASASPSHAPAYAAFVVGAAGVGMTAAFGILALSTNSTLSKDCTSGGCPAKDSSNVSNLKLYDNLADIGLGVAAAGIITGIVLYVTEKPSSGGGTASARPRERHIEPWLGLGAGGVRGSF